MAFCQSRTKSALALLTLVFGFSCAREGAAQVQRYQPQRPTVSPYLNLTRLDVSPLPNYYAFVRPEIQQRQVNVQQQSFILRQQGEILGLQRQMIQPGGPQMIQPGGPSTGTGSGFMVTGNLHSYLNTTGYYPLPNPPRTRR
jgi:hypothetical protein